jgi:ferritin-like metal-binding protein YciE
MPDSLRSRLITYLKDAHSIEEQALQQLERAPDVAGEPGLAKVLREHLEETRGHEQRIRALLDLRGESPSSFKDAVMSAGGDAFVLFAEAQTDTPGKLAAHAYSYEALEWASHDLLARTADRAEDREVASVARSIRDEEGRMMERIEELFDATADASLREASDDPIDDHLNRYLADAHALEAQSIQLLEGGVDMVEDATLSSLFRGHLEESLRQQELIRMRLDERGASRSLLKDTALRIGGLNWGMFFRAHPDTDGKLAAFAYAFEHLEIGGYEQLRRVAERAGDRATMEAAERILAEEREAAHRIRNAFDEAVTGALAATVREGD